MAESKLLPTNHQLIYLTFPSPTDLLVYFKSLPKEIAFTILYQKKIGLILYAVTTICPDIAFIVLWLIRFNQDLSQKHY